MLSCYCTLASNILTGEWLRKVNHDSTGVHDILYQVPKHLSLCCGKECFIYFSAHLSRRLQGSLWYRQAPSSVCPSVRRPSTISNDFTSETTGPIATKFHIQPPGLLGKKNCSNGLGHMTNMAAMPIYGKNLKKTSSPEPIDQ